MNFIRSEYSFKEVFYHLEEAVKDTKRLGHDSACLIDSNTFGYVKFEKLCKENDVRPIFGLEVFVSDTDLNHRTKLKTISKNEKVIIIAKSEKGVADIYKIYTTSVDREYKFAMVKPSILNNKDVIVLSDKFGIVGKSEFCIPETRFSVETDIPTYQCITGSRGIAANKNWALTDEELLEYFTQDQIDAKNGIPDLFQPHGLPRSGMIRYNGTRDFETECWKGLDKLGINGRKDYNERLNYEIKMIMSKDFQDYFMIVSEMIADARTQMITGPGRGSSGGSLVCYALGITNIDPIKFDLIFERFIDTNRSDFPDIDSDYPDTKRHLVIENTRKKYKSAYQLGTIYTYQPKTVLNDFAKEYGIPVYELDELKVSIIERSSGDARAKACLSDTFEGTKVGEDFLNRHPYMKSTARAEAHARQSGKHAAGIIVLDEDINNYAAFDKQRDIICMEGPDAESMGLLKIDCLGLRTLSIVEDCLRLSDIDINDIYKIDLEDKDVLNIFNTTDMSDVFQFDGSAIRTVNDGIEVKAFSDLAAITALGRPGALNSGGTGRYIKVNNGEEEPVYYGDIYEKITKYTNGIVVYQEQTMMLLREYGDLSWGDVNTMRKIISKSRGDEFFAKYKAKFIAGAGKNGYSNEDAEIVWDAIASMGSYAFNKSHAVAYAMISYWCAYCKLKYPLNWLAANLNNPKDEKHGLTMLRQYVKIHDLEYVPVDPDKSMVGWTIQDGKLVGGLTNIKGIAEKKALDIIDRRENGKPYTKSIFQKLMDPITPYDDLYPMETQYKELYSSWDITRIEYLKSDIGEATTIGKVTVKDLRDRNDLQSTLKRGGKKVTENTHYLNIIIEDDTGTIKCTVAPFDMDRLGGMELAESLAIGDLVAVKGTVRKGWSTLSVKEIKKYEDL